MSEREDPTSSGSKDQNEGSRTSSEPIPMASSNNSYFSVEPIHFRVRGSTITGASPPQFVTLEDIMKAAHGMQNMALAHEIAVDNDFKLEPFEPPDNSYQKLVKETMHRAYFDILREQLNSNPPEYKQALILLEDVKQGLFSILLPRHTRIREMIEEVLDAEFIQQQAKNKSLDFKKYANFVVDLMAKLAAPARDEMIQNITTLTDTLQRLFHPSNRKALLFMAELGRVVVPTRADSQEVLPPVTKFVQIEQFAVEIFKAILEALEVLKLDLANTLIAMIRPHVQKESVQYERAKFDEMLKVSEDGLQNTREWLKRHIKKTGLSIPVTDQNIIRNVAAQTLAKAYLELLEWDSSKGYPETVAIDAPRFSELGVQVYRMSCVAALLLASPTWSCSTDISTRYKEALKQKFFIIIDDASNDTELRPVLPSIAEEVVLATEQLLEKLKQRSLNPEMKELIRTQIISLGDPEHRVREIVRHRVLEFLKVILVCAGGSRQIPVGLSMLSRELTDISGTLLRYVMHNKAVFTQHYLDIVTEELSRN